MRLLKYTLPFFTLLLAACTPARDWQTLQIPEPSWKSKTLPPKPPQAPGDPEAGWRYLTEGSFLGAGVPVAAMGKRMPRQTDSALTRGGENAGVYHEYTVFKVQNGVSVVNGNCFACHSGYLNGQLVFGLGNTQTLFQNSLKIPAWLVNRMVRKRYKPGSPEYEAFGNFGDYYRGIASYVQVANPGANPAFRLEEACVRFRDPVDLRYNPTPRFAMQAYTLPSDVPPLWNVDKKNALYYNGMGRGDFRKLLLQAVVLATPDSATARRSLAGFADVLAWAEQIRPPVYPFPVNASTAAAGRVIFEQKCQGCHGRYHGDSIVYPNKLIALPVIKTDPLYAVYLAQRSGLPIWYNQSWFARSYPASSIEADYGYVAPPLDGIWATAPYLHNASVPTLADLLDSPRRPVYWERPADSRAYDPQKVGWQYLRRKNGRGKAVYDTTLPGYHNGGHTFGDKLSEKERLELLEYLKML